MKNMKRKALIVAVMALLLVAILAMSVSTFAKYTTSTTYTSGSAAVAAWGFAATIQPGEMFGDAYGAKDANSLTSIDTWVDDDPDAAGTLSVKADSLGSKVVAPGTKGSMTFSITGEAEVLAQIDVTVTASSDVYLTKDGKTYNPIKWTLTKAGEADAVLEDVTLAEVVTYLEAMDELVDPSEAYSKAGTYTIAWEWAFTGGATPITDAAADTVDEADTILGKLSNGTAVDGYTSYGTTVSLAFNIVIAQAQK